LQPANKTWSCKENCGKQGLPQDEWERILKHGVLAKLFFRVDLSRGLFLFEGYKITAVMLFTITSLNCHTPLKSGLIIAEMRGSPKTNRPCAGGAIQKYNFIKDPPIDTLQSS